MSTRFTSSNLFSPLRDPESLIRRRNLGEPSSLFDFEETMSIPHNNQGPPPAGPLSQNNNGPPPVVRPKVLQLPNLRSKESCANRAIMDGADNNTDSNSRLRILDFVSLPSNTVANPRGDLKAVTTRSGVSYDGPTIPPTSFPLPKEVEREPEATKDKVQPTNLGSTAHVQPPVAQVPIQEPEVIPKPNAKPSIPYPSRLNDQKLREKANYQMLKFLQIFQSLHFDLSFADALLHMPKFTSTFKSLLSNKEKLFELANTPLNENCSAVLLKKLPEKLGDPSKFLIPCDFSELDKCLALADLGSSINLMRLSVWKKLSLPELTPTRMTLELANRSVAYPVGVAEDFFVKVEKFHFLANFVVVDYDVYPRVPLILERPFLRTDCVLIDVHGEELILRDEDEQLIFHVDNTSKHPHESINMINFIDITCEDRFPEVLKFKKSNHPSKLSTESSLKTDIEIIDPILERFIDEPSHVYSPPPRDDDDDNENLFTTSLLVLPTMVPEDSLIMGDVDLSTIPEKESDEVIKSSDEDLVPILRESEDTSDSNNECDLPFSVFRRHTKSEDSYVSNFDDPVLPVTPLFDANKDECFDPGDDIDEINAFLDMDVSMDFEDDYYDSEGDIIYLESLLIKDTISNLPPKVFLDIDPKRLNDEPDNDLKNMVKVFDLGINEKIISPTYVRLPFEDRHYFSLTFVIKIFLLFLTYLVNSLPLLSTGSEDTIFDPGIFAFSFYSLEPVVSHRSGTFTCFNVYLNILNESLMEICSSTCFVPNITMI
ncbi:reverse transcriptase domain-containing protein [Tanacetum coccineum]